MTTEVALNFVQLLLSHHEYDDDISRIMKGYSLHILPALNRDGYGLNKAGECQSKAGSLNQAGIDLELDYKGSNPQPETQRIINWMDQQKFLFSINLRGSDENILIPLINQSQPLEQKLVRDFASQYWSHLRSDISVENSCTESQKNLVTSEPTTSSINYNWQHKDNVLELGIGLTCCPKPKEKELQNVWDKTRPALVGLLNSLQGIHVYVSNIDGREAVIVIEDNLILSLGPEGHLWHLMSNGTVTVTLKVEGFVPMTKLVRVFAAEFTEVNFDLPYPSGIPRAVTVLIISSIILVILLCMLASHCRSQEGKKSVRSYEGFQLLSRDERHIFEEDMMMDEEDEVEFFDKSVEQFGLKMPPSKVYRDFTDSSEEEEDFLKIPSASREKHRQKPL